MENTGSSTKKRKSAGNNGNRPEDNSLQLSKRSRAEETETGGNAETASIADSKEDAVHLSSAQELLSVPVSFIVRKVPSSINNAAATATAAASDPHHPHHNNNSNEKPLLSRSEAQCFCKINLLAHELDSLTLICTQLWQTQLQCETFSQSLEAVDHPFLRPLVILLDTFQRQTPSAALPRVAAELNRVVAELQQATATMRQCSDQNYALASTLHDSAPGGLLATAKENLSQVQEELCNRVEKLLARNSNDSSSSNSNNNGTDWNESEEQYSNLSASTARRVAVGPMVSMHEFCQRAFEADTVTNAAIISAAAPAHSCDDKDEILSEPEDEVELKPGSSTNRKSTPPSQEKQNSESPASLFSHATTRTTPNLTQPPKDAAKSPGSDEKENSQQSQRSSQSTSSAHRMQHRGGGESVLLSATRTAQEEEADIDDDMDDPGTTDSQVAAHVLSSFAATTLARSGRH